MENAGPAWRPGEGWRLAEQPEAEIGGSDDPRYDFSRATVLLGGTEIIVANRASQEIRFYDMGGRFLRSSGRRGAGPGEFRSISIVWRGVGDSLLVSDGSLRRLSVLTPEGAYARSFTLGGVAEGMLIEAGGSLTLTQPRGWLADGSIPAVISTSNFDDPRDGRFRDTIPVQRFGADGSGSDTVAWIPGPEQDRANLPMGPGGETRSIRMQVMMGRNSFVWGQGDHLYIARNQAMWEVEIRDRHGALRRIIRISGDPAPFTQAHVSAHQREELALLEQSPEVRMMPQMRPVAEAQIASYKYPETFSWIAAIRVEDDGTLWTRDVTPPGETRERWTVIAPDGRCLGRITLPPRFTLSDVRGGRVAGIWRDEDDLEYVRVYALSAER